jgi:hypothetical protein
MDKTIRRITSTEEQDAETYRYWQRRPVGERLLAICELSQAAYSFAAGFRGVAGDDGDLGRSWGANASSG